MTLCLRCFLQQLCRCYRCSRSRFIRVPIVRHALRAWLLLFMKESRACYIFSIGYSSPISCVTLAKFLVGYGLSLSFWRRSGTWFCIRQILLGSKCLRSCICHSFFFGLSSFLGILRKQGGWGPSWVLIIYSWSSSFLRWSYKTFDCSFPGARNKRVGWSKFWALFSFW